MTSYNANPTHLEKKHADNSLFGKSVQEKVYKNSGNSHVLALIPASAKMILDLGCGAGDNAEILKGRGCIVDGVTLSQKEADAAGLFCRNIFVYNLENGLPHKCQDVYDVIIASHVLEHICFPESLLKDIYSRLSADGVLIIALPNLLNWRYRMKLLFGRFEYEKSGIMDDTHFRWYTFKSAAALLKSSRFSVVCSYADGYFPLYFFRKIMWRAMSTKIDIFACTLFPGLFGYQLIYVAKRQQTEF